PPPYASAPTLNATQTSATSPPVAAPATAASGQTCALNPSVRAGRCHDSSMTPQPRSTRTSQGPSVAAATPPSAAYAIQRQCAGDRLQLSGTSPMPARTATAATAAPAPAPAPRTQSGGEPRKMAASPRIITSPGRINAAPPRTAPIGPATRHAQKIASCVDAGPGSRLHAATA